MENEDVWSPTSLNSFNDSDLFSPTAHPPSTSENLSENDHQIRKRAKKAVKFEANLVELQVDLLKNACKRKVKSFRQVNIEVKEELKEFRDENAKLRRQVGRYKAQAEFLTRENEVFLKTILILN